MGVVIALSGCKSARRKKREYRAYSSWYNMKDRCNNPKNPKAHLYSEKGITYTSKWETFGGFLEDMGERPAGTSLDRVNGSLGYYKENCRWADTHTQANNVKRKVSGTITDMSKQRKSHHRSKQFQAAIGIQGKSYSSYFASETEAREWLNKVIGEWYGNTDSIERV